MIDLMEKLLLGMFVIGCFVLALAFGLDYLRRQLSMKRKDYRMRAALRRGLFNSDGVQMSHAPRMIQWQACEPSSRRS
jgi:hypothetical protein